MDTKKSVNATEASTPLVTSSISTKYLIFVFLMIMLFATIFIIWRNSESKEDDDSSPSEQPSTPAFIVPSTKSNLTYDMSYDMSTVNYGDSLVLEIKPGKRIMVQLVKGWNPIWSNKRINVYCSDKNERVLEEETFIEGPKNFKGAGLWFLFHNESSEKITVKVGRCKSKNDCNINF